MTEIHNWDSLGVSQSIFSGLSLLIKTTIMSRHTPGSRILFTLYSESIVTFVQFSQDFTEGGLSLINIKVFTLHNLNLIWNILLNHRNCFLYYYFIIVKPMVIFQ